MWNGEQQLHLVRYRKIQQLSPQMVGVNKQVDPGQECELLRQVILENQDLLQPKE